VPCGQPLPRRAPLASLQLPLPSPRQGRDVPWPVRLTQSSIAGIEETEGSSTPAAAPSRPLAGPQLPPAWSASRLWCPLVGSPTTQSSIAMFEETEGSFAPAAALDGYRAPLAGRSAPPASSRPMNITCQQTSISPRQQRDVALKAHVASIHFKCFRRMLQVFSHECCKSRTGCCICCNSLYT
jgi:hypothetical protein